MSSEILITEKCGSLGQLVLYKQKNENELRRLCSTHHSIPNSLIKKGQDFFREVFLPHGYPDSVSDDYLEYQIWDTVQAFCSTITGTFTTQAILKGVGVGNAEATPFAAAITWIVKDGTGMIGRILFAWWKGANLDADCKKWRLFADIMNDGAMFLELLVPYVSAISWQVLCITTALKALVGVAGGATRASITQHQAIRGNMADVSAKDGSQETFVNLLASIVGIILLALSNEGYAQWLIFIFFAAVHLVANYYAVCALIFPFLNNGRLLLVLKTYLRYDTVSNPTHVNQKESVIVGLGNSEWELCAFTVKLGCSLDDIPSFVNVLELKHILELYKNHKYLIVPDIKNRVMYVALEQGENSEDVLTAYFHAVLLGIATCYYNEIPVNLEAKRQLHHLTPIVRLRSCMKHFDKNTNEQELNLPIKYLKQFNDFVGQETKMFFTALKINGWNTETHAIQIGEWRATWKQEQIESIYENKITGDKKID